MLALQAMLLSMIMLMASSTRLPMRRRMRSNILLVTLQLCLIHIIQNLHTKLNIAKQLITSRFRKVFADNDTEHFQVVCVRGHRIRRYDPTSASQLMSECKLIIVLLASFEAECDEWETLAVLLGHDDETELLEGVGEVVCGAG